MSCIDAHSPPPPCRRALRTNGVGVNTTHLHFSTRSGSHATSPSRRTGSPITGGAGATTRRLDYRQVGARARAEVGENVSADDSCDAGVAARGDGTGRQGRDRTALGAPAAPTPAALRAIYADLLRLPNVVGCAVGFKRRRGRATKTLAIVCCVTEKVVAKELESAARVPKSLTWGPAGGEPRSMPTDVVVLGTHLRQGAPNAASLGPGDAILGSTTVTGAPLGGTGTVGIAMQHPLYGPVLTTAGHVIGQTTLGTMVYPAGGEPVVTVLDPAGGGGTLQLRALKAVFTTESDYGLLALESGESAANMYGTQSALGRVYVPSPSDLVGSPSLRVLCAGGVVPVTLYYVDHYAAVGSAPLAHAILTTFATQGGDSGACLVDDANRPWGLLVGQTTLDGTLYSVFTPAYLPLLLESAQML